MHGDRAIIEDIVDWRPFHSVSFATLLPAPQAPKVPMTYLFRGTEDGGTRVEIRIARPQPKDRDFVERAAVHFAMTISAEVLVLKRMIETGTVETDGEPPLPNAGRRDPSAP